MDCQPIHCSSRIQALTGCAGRIQRQIYVRPNDSPRRILCYPTRSCPRHLSQLLSTRNPLAIHRHTPRRLTPLKGINGCPTFAKAYSGFPVELPGVGELHAAFLNESRTRGCWWGLVQEIRIRGTKTMGEAQRSLSLHRPQSCHDSSRIFREPLQPRATSKPIEYRQMRLKLVTVGPPSRIRQSHPDSLPIDPASSEQLGPASALAFRVH